MRNVEYLILNQMLSTLIRVKGNTYSESLNGTEDENKHTNMIHDIIYLILPLLGAHTIGNEDNTNFLISFTMDLRQHIQDSPVRVVRVRWWLLRIYYWTHNMECIRQKSASILFTTLAPVGTLRHFWIR